jgi:YidC/Oxa1 family membrane protein insertase
MSNIRLFLLIGLAFVCYSLFQAWQVDYGPKPVTGDAGLGREPEPTASAPIDVPPVSSVPNEEAVPQPVTSGQMPVQAPAQADDQLIHIRTDVLDLTLSSRGGDVVQARLLNYPVALRTPDQKVQLLGTQAAYFHIAQSGLLSSSHESPDHRQRFSAEASEYVLAESADSLEVSLVWRDDDGLKVTKRYGFERGSYQIALNQEISNNSGTAWTGAQYRQLQRVAPPASDKGGFTKPERYSFMGAAIYTPEEKYEKFDFEDMDDGETSRQSDNAWAAMVQHYFLAAWVPARDEINTLSTAVVGSGEDKRYLVRVISPGVEIAPGKERSLGTILYVGPKLQDDLDELADGLELTVDYGIFTPFSKILFWLLNHIYNLVGNWGWAIILLTVLVKAVFFKLTEAQYKSMAKMRKLQPRIQSLKERYGDDKQQFNVAMMEIYKKEKVNPLGGCLPMLVQIPVFIALYWVLLESVELRQASFMLWLQDLSSPDPYFILPIINGAAMFMTTKLSPNPAADPVQQKVMMAMPLVFSVMFAFFQSGLVLYWAVNSVLSLAQQWVITKKIEAMG